MATATGRSCMLFFLCVALGAGADAAQRTFVSTSGNDLNACSLAAPCRGFAKAITLTDPGGELVVLDSGGYGSVTVDKSVAIVSPVGVYAGISVFAGQTGVDVVAPAVNVVLRGLAINGQGGSIGIRVQAGEVHIENCVISGIHTVGAAGILIEGGTSVRIAGTVVRNSTQGMNVMPGSGTVTVHVRDSEFSNSGQLGIRVSPVGTGNNALVTIERSSVTKSTGYGIFSGPTGGATATVVVTQSVLSEHAIAGITTAFSGATVWVRESAITRNGTGLQSAGGTLNACGANLLVANTTPTSGTINTASCLDVAGGAGTVTSVAAGAGLTGGPVTTTGTISVANAGITAAMLAQNGCGSGQLMKWNGAAWACANDVDTNSGGTLTSVATGTGLTGGPITGTGTVSIANGGVGNAQLGNGGVTVAKLDTASTDARYFKQGGNSLGTIAVFGTADNQTLELHANDTAGLRLQPTAADPANNFNTATPNVIGGWNVNAPYAGVMGATIGGGGGDILGILRFNLVTDHYGTVGGGAGNTAGDALGTTRDRPFATVGGGVGNTASGYSSTVGGGSLNTAIGDSSTVGGGYNNTASGDQGTVAGGLLNTATGALSTVGGGDFNTASGERSTVGGGYNNTASGDSSTVGGGDFNTASGFYSTVSGGRVNTASGDYSIAGGRSSEARGDYSISLGRRAKTFVGGNIGNGTIVLADGNDFDFAESFDNRFAVRSTGGVRFVLGIDGTGAATWTCSASSGIGWACASDRNLKHSLVELDGKAVLAKLAAMPVYQWQPKGQNAHVKHFGPVAQDFYATFGLGDDDKMIGMQDADGVALAAIQGVNQKLDEQLHAKDDEIVALRASLVELKRAVDMLIAAR